MILVTGSTGYIGSQLVRLLLRQGKSVRGLVHPQEARAARDLIELGMEAWYGDLLSPGTLDAIGRDVTIIYHLAGTHSPPLERIRQVYVQGTHHLIQACKGYPTLERCIVASNGSVYGDGGERWLAENDQLSTALHPFGTITTEMEQMLLVEDHFPSVILRISEVYGPGSYNMTSQNRIIRLFGDGKNWTSHIHIQDLLAILCRAAIELPPGEIYNVTDDLPVRADVFYTYIAQLGSIPGPQWTPIKGIPERIWLSVHGLRSFSLRISNVKLKARLAFSFQFPTYMEGLHSLL